MPLPLHIQPKPTILVLLAKQLKYIWGQAQGPCLASKSNEHNKMLNGFEIEMLNGFEMEMVNGFEMVIGNKTDKDIYAGRATFQAHTQQLCLACKTVRMPL